jgi:hypothetical protein
MSLEWRKVSQDDDYCFQCPISGAIVHITTYSDLYGPFLETLDGRDLSSYIDFFYRKSPVNQLLWEFVDEDARLDFIDLCQEIGLMPDIQRIQFGDWDCDSSEKTKKKKNPKPKSKSNTPNDSVPQIQQNIIKNIINAKPTESEKIDKIKQSRIESIKKLEEQLQKAQEGDAKNRLEAKINKIKLQLESV